MNTDSRKFQTALDCIYEAPLNGNAWAPALTAIADLVGAECADLNFFDRKLLAYKRWEHARIDSNAIQRYMHGFMDDMHNTHPRMPVVARMKNGQMFADSERWNRVERERMPLFVDVFHRMSLQDGITACVNAGGNSDLIVLGMYYDREIKPASLPTRQRRLATVLPHIRRACAMEEKLLQARKESAVLTEVFNQMNEGVVMLGLSGQVVFANQSAATLFNSGNGIGLSGEGRLWPSTAEARTELARALKHCAGTLPNTPANDSGLIAPITIFRPNCLPLILTIQALPQSLAGAYGAVALAFINGPQRTEESFHSTLRANYKLTPAELQLVCAIRSGATLKRYADTHQISYETARTYLRRIFEKTGVKRQSELVGLLSTLR